MCPCDTSREREPLWVQPLLGVETSHPSQSNATPQRFAIQRKLDVELEKGGELELSQPDTTLMRRSWSDTQKLLPIRLGKSTGGDSTGIPITRFRVVDLM
jgi:hypothetical protein